MRDFERFFEEDDLNSSISEEEQKIDEIEIQVTKEFENEQKQVQMSDSIIKRYIPGNEPKKEKKKTVPADSPIMAGSYLGSIKRSLREEVAAKIPKQEVLEDENEQLRLKETI